MKSLKKGSKLPKVAIGVFIASLCIVAISIVLVNVTDSKTDVIKTSTQTTDAQAATIKSSLSDCGINDIKSITYDADMGALKGDGINGYRVSTKDATNIIMYLTQDNVLLNVRYNDKDLYVDGNVVMKLGDLTVTFSEKDSIVVYGKDVVRSVLSAPDAAKFPGILDWGFTKNPDNQQITASAYVDAQNAFGATVRSEFTLTYSGSNLVSFTFDGVKII